jgi:mono/diheme cytochrome c family protein
MSAANPQGAPSPYWPRVMVVAAAGAAATLVAAVAQTPTPPSAVTFTTAQVERARAVYNHSCQDCHGTELDNGEFGGPALKGSYFRGRWTSRTAADLFGFMQVTMPPDRPGGLSARTYADLTAFILSHNGYSPGDKELPVELDALQKMSLQR